MPFSTFINFLEKFKKKKSLQKQRKNSSVYLSEDIPRTDETFQFSEKVSLSRHTHTRAIPSIIHTINRSFPLPHFFLRRWEINDLLKRIRQVCSFSFACGHYFISLSRISPRDIREHRARAYNYAGREFR